MMLRRRILYTKAPPTMVLGYGVRLVRVGALIIALSLISDVLIKTKPKKKRRGGRI